MKSIIPYEKEIKFDTKISEITSISLEHEENRSDNEIIGSFIVTGDYKIHQISVNKEKFEYKIPFTIELPDNIDKDSIKLDINDFTYDIKDDDTLVVKIELDFTYDEIEIIEVEEVTNIKEEDKNQEEDRLDDEIEKLINEDNKNEKINEEKELSNPIINNNVTDSENTYVTYHVYIVTKEDSLESICQKYNVSKELLHEYNDFEEISSGDKLLIPIEDNE